MRRIGPHQYVIEGTGQDAYGQPNVWHVDLSNPDVPVCDCPASHYDPQCKHICFLQFVEAMLADAGR
jgi:uncharacterized Zn finger protein